MKNVFFVFAAAASIFLISCVDMGPSFRPQPNGLDVVSVGSTTAQVKWNNAGKDYYGNEYSYVLSCCLLKIYVVSEQDGQITIGKSPGENVYSDTVADTTALIVGLSPDTEYAFCVDIASDAITIPSNWFYFRTKKE